MSAAVGICTLSVLSHLIEPSQFGHVALSLTLSFAVNQVVFGPLANSIVRFLAPALQDGKLREYVAAVAKLSATRTLLVLAFGALAAGVMMACSVQSYILLVSLATLNALLVGLNSLGEQFLNAARLRREVAIGQITHSLLKLSLVFIFVASTNASAEAVLASYVTSTAAATCLLFYWSWCWFGKQANSQPVQPADDLLRKMLNYARSFSIFGVFTTIHGASDRWSVAYWRSSEAVGAYSLSYQLGYLPIQMICSVIEQIATPILFDSFAASNSSGKPKVIQKIRWIAYAVILATTLISMLAALLPISFYKMLIASQYLESTGLIPYMILAAGLFGAGQILSIQVLLFFRSDLLMRVKIGLSVLGVIGNFCLVHYFGTRGVVACLLLYAIGFVFLMLTLPFRFQEPEPSC